MIAIAFAACNNNTETDEEAGSEEVQEVAGRYGDTTWVAMAEWEGSTLIDSLQGKDSMYVKVAGEISSVCQAKGCWMKIDQGGTPVTIKFKDYSYFVPMNSAGYEASVLGMAYRQEVSVAELQEFAKDAEKSEEEIAAITEPEMRYRIMAEGVVIHEK